MSMRLQMNQAREKILQDSASATDEASVAKQLEQLFDMSIDIHKQFVESPECSEDYADFYSRTHDVDFVTKPEWKDKALKASLKSMYTSPKTGQTLAMLTRVYISFIDPMGVVTFFHPNLGDQPNVVFADELMRYAYE